MFPVIIGILLRSLKFQTSGIRATIIVRLLGIKVIWFVLYLYYFVTWTLILFWDFIFAIIIMIVSLEFFFFLFDHNIIIIICAFMFCVRIPWEKLFFSRSRIIIHFLFVVHVFVFLWLLVLFPYACHESMPYMPWHDIHVIHNLWLYYIIIRKPLLRIVKCNLAFAFYFCFPCFYLWIMCINWWFPLCFGVNSEITNPQNYSFFMSGNFDWVYWNNILSKQSLLHKLI